MFPTQVEAAEIFKQYLKEQKTRLNFPNTNLTDKLYRK